MNNHKSITRSSGSQYSRPEVARFDVAVERGFAQSLTGAGEIPDLQ